MQTEVATNGIQARVGDFELELKRVLNTGYIIKTLSIKKVTEDGTIKGVELLVDNRVTKSQINQIVAYIKRLYNFDVYFYAKSYSIKVWYANSK